MQTEIITIRIFYAQKLRPYYHIFGEINKLGDVGQKFFTPTPLKITLIMLGRLSVIIHVNMNDFRT